MENNNCYVADVFGDGRLLEIEKNGGIFECYLDHKLVISSSRIEPIILVLVTGLKNYFYLVNDPAVEFNEVPDFSKKDFCLLRAFDFIDDPFDLDNRSLLFRRLLDFDPAVELFNLNKFSRPAVTTLKIPNSLGGEDTLTFELKDHNKTIYLNDKLLVGSMCYLVPLFAFLAIMNVNTESTQKINLSLAFEDLSKDALNLLNELLELEDLKLDDSFKNFVLSNLKVDSQS